jgi:redox-sensing transcriptional repressor
VTDDRSIPDATVARLPLYLRALVAFEEQGVPTVSSGDLALASGVNPAKLRKDLSHLGSFGTRGVGYPVKELIQGISDALGLSDERALVIVGLGNLGQALAAYGGFADRGFQIAGLLDADPAVIGAAVGDATIEDVAELEDIVADRGVTIAVLATPAAAAQQVADRLVAAGVTAILNFAPAYVDVPPSVTLRKVDLSVELQILSFYEQFHANGDLDL